MIQETIQADIQFGRNSGARPRFLSVATPDTTKVIRMDRTNGMRRAA
jgi:hypothetical protein